MIGDIIPPIPLIIPLMRLALIVQHFTNDQKSDDAQSKTGV